jgi:formiminoglutamate deiminase
MYDLAVSLTPASLAAVSEAAFRGLARAGVRTVGEFHYVHHQQGGVPYAQRTLLADVVIEAARAAGLRIALLRVAYHRAGPGAGAGATGAGGQAPEIALSPAQLRFCDPSVDHVLRDVDTLRARWASDPGVVIGVAPHSVRAVPPAWLSPLAAYAAEHALPFHMHVAEQAGEVDACLAESGRRPVELLADRGVLSERFVAVHATNVLAHEARLLGAAGAFACICPTTERDLGDGLPDVTALRAAGVRLCTGVDSHVLVDPLEDLRALETNERLRTRARVTFRPASGTPAETLWREGSLEGAAACGFADAGGAVLVDRDHPSLAFVDPEYLLDAVVFGCGSDVLLRGPASPARP